MLKRILLSGILLGSSISFVVANEISLVSQSSLKYININKYVENLNKYVKDIKNYVLLTGDKSLQGYKGELLNYKKTGQVLYNLSENYTELSNLGSLSKEELKYLLHSLNLPSGTEYKNGVLYYLNDFKYKNYLKLLSEVSILKNVSISKSPLEDKSKLWYQPYNYGFLIYYNNNGNWEKIGKLENEGTINIDYIFPNIELLSHYSFPNYTSIYVDNGETIKLYQYVDGKYISLETSTAQYYGTATLEDTLTTLYNKQGQSKVFIKSENPNNLPLSNSYYVFVKHDNYSNGGYWQTEDGKYTLYNNFKNLNKVINYVPNNGVLLTKDSNYNIIKLQKIVLNNGNSVFAYIANNMKEVINFLSAKPINGKVYVTDIKDDFYFLKDNDKSFKPLNNKYFIGIDRNSFNNTQKNFTYLTNINDCNANTCYGDKPSFYAGKTIDNLFQFYFVNNNHSINKLADAFLIKNKFDIYSKLYPAVLYIGESFNDLKYNHVYIKTSFHDNIAYKDNDNDRIINKNQFLFLPKLPYKYNAINVNLTKSNNNYIVVLNDDYDIYDFNDMDKGYWVYGNNIGTVQKCSNNILWSNKCSNIPNSNIVISDFRKNIPNPYIKDRINLTNHLDSPRYTDNGVHWNKNNKFLQWFFVKGKGINDMIDLYCEEGYKLENSETKICSKFLGWKFEKGYKSSLDAGGTFRLNLTFKTNAVIDYVAYSEDTELNVYIKHNNNTKHLMYWGGKGWEGRCSSIVLKGNLLGFHDDGCTAQPTVDYFAQKNLKVLKGDLFHLYVREGGSCSSPLSGYKILIKSNNEEESPVDGAVKEYDKNCPLYFTFNKNKTSCYLK